MAHLHPERWLELEPDFAAADHLDQAIKAYGGVDSPHPIARELARVRGKMHECTRSPAARDEFAARKAGTFEELSPAKAQARDGRVLDAQARYIAELEAKVKALGSGNTEPSGPHAEGVIRPRGAGPNTGNG